jgi:hypothetical protein
MKRSLAERFWSKVDFSGECWEWKAAKTLNGYGIFRLSSSFANYAHRFVWELFNGPIPDGIFTLHRCDNRSCVNPSHLFLGSADDNAKDMVFKHRQSMGEHRPLHKLTVNQVREILSSPLLQKEIAEKFGVSQQLISGIRLRRRWRHVSVSHS